MSESPLRGRGAVVTGGGRGIGAAVARRLGAAGAAVVVAARSAAEVDAVAAGLRRQGARAWAVTCDVSDPGQVDQLAAAARSHLGTVDVLINNAGVSSSAPFKRLTFDEWRRMFAVNTDGTFLCMRAFLPAMTERGWGRIVNIVSTAGLHGGRYIAHYSAAKHAVVGLTSSVALEVAGTGVTVSAVCPGYVDTPMTERTLANVVARTGLSPDAALRAVLESAGQHRLITPDEVAAAVLTACEDESGERNGDVLILEGKA